MTFKEKDALYSGPAGTFHLLRRMDFASSQHWLVVVWRYKPTEGWRYWALHCGSAGVASKLMRRKPWRLIRDEHAIEYTPNEQFSWDRLPRID